MGHIALLLLAWGAAVAPSPLVRAFSSLPPISPPASTHHLPRPCSHHTTSPWTRLQLVTGDDGDDRTINGDGDVADEEYGLPPLFVEAPDSSVQSAIHDNMSISLGTEGIPPSLQHSIQRVREKYLMPSTHDDASADSKDDVLKRIVQAGIRLQQTKQAVAIDDAHMERVPGCIATVHVKTTLIPTPDHLGSNTGSYRVLVGGTADAMLSRGLLALLSEALANATAADVLTLDPESLTSSMGLRSVLSRGRNDGMASMVRVIQRQIRALIGEAGDAPKDLQSPSKSESQTETSGKPRVAMLLTGGVDSSVALHLLLQQNYDVTAFYLRIWLEDELSHLGECPWEDDLAVCQAVCEHAGDVPLQTVSLGKEYRERVVQYTIEEAQRGRTPNPDIMCNSRVKFGCFLEYIEESGMDFDYVASGHYARLEDEVPLDGAEQPTKRLFRAPDPVKDQSYFLCALTQKQLSKVLFPIGQYQKSEVRELATQFELPNRNRPDSQGLCFLGKVRFDDFLASYLGNRPGDVVDALTGEVIGRHNGLWFHTVGQRKGIGKVMFPLATARGPWYVVAKDQERDIVYVSNRYDEEDFARARSEFEVEDVRWISGDAPIECRADAGGGWKEVRMDMKIRHGPKIVQGTLLLSGDGSTGNVLLDKKDGGLAPGQYVVLYRLGTDECLGAGVISEKHWAKFLCDIREPVANQTEATGMPR
ncbi:hypothetical protein ACHAXT_009326 [Thalassiosira profunda]